MMSDVPHTGSRPGFLLLEALLGIAIFAIFLSALAITIIYGQESTVIAGDRTRGSYLTEQALEAVRSIRDGSFSSVTSGMHGVWINGGNIWAFSGSSVVESGGYVTSVSISSLSSDWMTMTGSTYWKHGYNRAGTATLVTELTDWQTKTAVGNWASPSIEGTYNAGTAVGFNRIAVSGDTAYVTTDASNGLYLLDISNPASPARVDSSFSIGYGATDAVIHGRRLYVMTADPNAELKLYSIDAPQSPVLLASYNLPGSALGKELGFGRNDLYVAATTPGSGQHQLYSFDATDSGALTLMGTIDDTDNYNAVALSGTAAYIATSLDADELRVVNAMSSGSISIAGGYNLSGTYDASAIAVSGTSALLGTLQTGSQNMVMFDISDASNGVPTPPPGPWYYNASGSVLGLAMDPNHCYAFVGAATGHKAFQVVDMRNKSSLPQLYSYDSSYGKGRSVAYDPVSDRIYLMTDNAVLIFQPGTGGTSCP
ncbi:MAG TPA: hypothetical protein VHA78_02140 [Candidatus Peribacteraceae bacterium]|nr:hypothetical protein [Candidatus Peribacteraceae bacterium]